MFGSLPMTLPAIQPPVVDDVDVQDNDLGFAAEQPTDGPFVDLGDGRFMVTYTAAIPGTEIKFTMVPVKAGTFTMGNDEVEDQSPTFQVAVQPFWIGQFEVTWAEYRRYMQMVNIFAMLQRDGMRTVKEETKIDAVTAPSVLYDPSFVFDAGQEYNQPAATMSHFAARQYTKWLSLTSDVFYRLPYESEWEYACRAGTETPWYFGDDEDELMDHAWFIDNSDDMRQVVGTTAGGANPWGLYDMYGNVAEWTLDQYDEEGYPHVKDLDLSQPLTVEQAFRKPDSLYPRSLRGGTYQFDADQCTSTSRMASEEDWRDDDPNTPRSPWWHTREPATGAGFRLVRPLAVPDRDVQESFWKADNAADERSARFKVTLGKGAVAPVDPAIVDQITELGEEAESDE